MIYDYVSLVHDLCIYPFTFVYASLSQATSCPYECPDDAFDGPGRSPLVEWSVGQEWTQARSLWYPQFTGHGSDVLLLTATHIFLLLRYGLL